MQKAGGRMTRASIGTANAPHWERAGCERNRADHHTARRGVCPAL